MAQYNIFSILKNKLSGTKNTDLIIFFLVAAILVSANTLFEIRTRFTSDPNLVHDGAMQTEEAIKLLLKGKNPYTETYFGTPLEFRGIQRETNDINPALYHLVYLPFTIIFSIPFYAISTFLAGNFDERIVYLFIFISFIALILKWQDQSLRRKLIFLFLFTVNPAFFIFFNEGRNDIFVFFWIALALYFLEQKRYNLSSLALALAAAAKQTSWMLLPFYFAYLYYQETHGTLLPEKIKSILKKTYLFFLTAGLIIIPFLAWDANSFIDDTIKYTNGTAFMSYPITGFGFAEMILKMGLVASPSDYWPFWIPQLIVGLPMLYVLLEKQKRNNTIPQILFNFSLFLMTYWLFSRFFNDNYIGFLLMVWGLALFLDKPAVLNPKRT